MRGAALSVWVRVTGLLVGFWILLHGPRLPQALPTREPTLPETLVGVVLASLALLVLTVLGLVLTPELSQRSRLGGASGRAYLGATACVLGVSCALDAALALAGRGEEGELGALGRFFAGLPLDERLLLGAVLAIGPGFAEELAFRGFVLGRIAAVSGAPAGLAFSSLSFGLFHFDPTYVVVTTVIGLALGWVTLRVGVLGPAMVAHAANNAVSVLGAGLELPGLGAAAVLLAGAAAAGWGVRVLSSLPPAVEPDPSEPQPSDPG